MAKEVLTFIHTSEEKVPGIDYKYGQLIFAEDARKIYFDGDSRVVYDGIIRLTDDETRQALSQPIMGFYFTLEECVLWYYDANGNWNKLTSEPKQQIQFYNSRAEFPEIGESGILYVTGVLMYRWLSGSYIKMDTGVTPEWIDV